MVFLASAEVVVWFFGRVVGMGRVGEVVERVDLVVTVISFGEKLLAKIWTKKERKFECIEFI